jgi:hypothetical protein
MKAGKGRILIAWATTVLSTSLAMADVVTFAATGPGNSAWAQNLGTWSTVSWRSVVSPPGGTGSKATTSPGASFYLKPTLANPGGTYRFQITHPVRPDTASQKVSADIIVRVTALTGCTLIDNAGNTISSFTTTAFQRPGGNTWEIGGRLKLNDGSSMPIITLTAANTYTDYFYADGFRFEYIPPCPVPAADADGDNDVDQDDFAAFQLCFSGQGKPLLGEGCACFDRGPAGADDDVDADDLDAFTNCLSGPTIPWTPTPGCPG